MSVWAVYRVVNALLIAACLILVGICVASFAHADHEHSGTKIEIVSDWSEPVGSRFDVGRGIKVVRLPDQQLKCILWSRPVYLGNASISDSGMSCKEDLK